MNRCQLIDTGHDLWYTERRYMYPICKGYLMSYAERRKRSEDNDQSHYRHDFGWEEQQLPVLHSGFTEPVSKHPEKSRLFVSLFFANGSYRARIQDRETDEKAFLDVGTLREFLDKVESALANDALDWTPDRQSRNGTWAR